MNNEPTSIRKPLAGDDIADVNVEFAACDTDGDGRIGFSEFECLLRSCDSRLSPEQLRTVFSRIDVDGDGLIDLAEFRRWS